MSGILTSETSRNATFIPTKQNYEDFATKFVEGLRSLKSEKISLMQYGSFDRGDYTPGISDYDATLVFWDDVVINKDRLMAAASIVAEALKNNPIEAQICACDISSLRDGRFNYYNDDYENYFKTDGNIVLGSDPRPEMRFEKAKRGLLQTASYNLEHLRTSTLFSMHYAQKNKFFLGEKARKSVDSMLKVAKQILFLQDKALRLDKTGIISDLLSYYPSLNVETIRKVKILRENVEGFYKLSNNPDYAIPLIIEVTTQAEEIIKHFLKANPRREF